MTTKHRMKIGDKVRFIDNAWFSAHGLQVPISGTEEEGIVEEITDDGLLCVQLTNNPNDESYGYREWDQSSVRLLESEDVENGCPAPIG